MLARRRLPASAVELEGETNEVSCPFGAAAGARTRSSVEAGEDVHDLHLWTLTSDMEVASAHLVVRQGADAHGVLGRARALLKDRYGTGHATLQVEPDDHRGCDEIAW